MRLHFKHGVAPAMTCCQLCGEDGPEILLLGASADKIWREQFGEAYEPTTAKRIPSGLCARCKAALQSGAAAYFCKNPPQMIMLSAECVARNALPNPGKISEVSPESMCNLQRVFNPQPENTVLA